MTLTVVLTYKRVFSLSFIRFPKENQVEVWLDPWVGLLVCVRVN